MNRSFSLRVIETDLWREEIVFRSIVDQDLFKAFFGSDGGMMITSKEVYVKWEEEDNVYSSVHSRIQRETFNNWRKREMWWLFGSVSIGHHRRTVHGSNIERDGFQPQRGISSRSSNDTKQSWSQCSNGTSIHERPEKDERTWSFKR